MKIGIAGVGGVGSNVAVHLVRSGITELKFGDFDKVEFSNLNRQFYFFHQIEKYKVYALTENLKAIFPQVNCQGEVIKFNYKNIVKFFEDCDIIVEGFDRKEEKNMFLKAFFSSKKQVYIVNGIAGISTANILTTKIRDNITMIGDFKSDISYYNLYSHKVNAVVCKISELILKEVLNAK